MEIILYCPSDILGGARTELFVSGCDDLVIGKIAFDQNIPDAVRHFLHHPAPIGLPCRFYNFMDNVLNLLLHDL